MTIQELCHPDVMQRIMLRLRPKYEPWYREFLATIEHTKHEVCCMDATLVEVDVPIVVDAILTQE